MLVLTRKLQQQIKIGDQITVTVLRVKGNTVRIGVAAPRDVRVTRGELPKSGAAEPHSAASNGHADEPSADDLSRLEADESAAAETAAASAAPRLPQLRPFDRYGAAPLKEMVAHAVLAK